MGAATVETGFLGALVDAVNGGPAKRKRAKRELEAAAKLEAEAAAVKARIAAKRDAAASAGAEAGLLGRLLSMLREPSPILGLPWWVLLAIVVVFGGWSLLLLVGVL